MPDFGYQEFEHTADWGIQVWGEDMVALLCAAAEGMFSLLDVSIEPEGQRPIDITITDAESAEILVVDFLNELLYLSERDNLAFDDFHLSYNDDVLRGTASGSKIISQGKEIKAVTFHNLEVTQSERGYEVSIVFDV